jgi:peroxiredoxin
MHRHKQIFTSVFVMAFLCAVNAQQRSVDTNARSSLLELEGIDIELKTDEVKGKMLLLCFWDIQQRPSRNLLIELAGHKEEFKKKGVVVLLVHTSEIKVDEFKSWIDKNNIPYICGRITNDTQRVLYRWGVKGQPWLVLTDENDTIRVGGFELEQLDEILLKASSAGPSEKEIDEILDKINLKLIDSGGLPVGGAKVGTNVRSRDKFMLNSNLYFSLGSDDHNISNKWGEIVLSREQLFPPYWTEGRKRALYVLHEERKIGAVCEISKDDKQQVIELTLEPVCHVYGKLDSEGLKKVGRPLTWTNVYLSWNRDSHGVMSHSSQEQRFEFFVPPGKYQLYAYGSGEGTSTETASPKIVIEPGQSELDMGTIDLPAKKLSTLIGKPAPEIGPIKTWKNGSPVKLADLHGKLVILHFGGEYPSTSGNLPRLVELHEDFEHAGLVIIALYNCESMEQLEQRFKDGFEKHGGEPDLPFRIAIDGGEGRTIEGSDRTIPGATYATYDITSYSTTVLIDRNGKIVEKLNLYDAKKKLETILDVSIKPELATWRQRFNKVYFLEDGQVLKRIAPPFIPEREDYYKEEESSQYSHIQRPPDFFTFHWDGELKRWGYGFGSGERPLKSVLSSNLSMNKNSYEGPEELLEVEVPGDWIVRKDTSEEQKLRALEQILAKEIGRNVRFVKRTVERKAIVATGIFKYHRLPVAKDDRYILMFSGDFVEESRGGGGTADSVHEFLEAVGNRVNMPVIDQTEQLGELQIPYRHYRSAYLSRIEDPAEKEKKLIQLLDNISRQTNLQFRVEMQPVEKWFVTEEAQQN